MVFQYADVNWAWSSTHHHARSLVYPGQQPAEERTTKSTNASQSRYVGGWHTTEMTRRHTHNTLKAQAEEIIQSELIYD